MTLYEKIHCPIGRDLGGLSIKMGKHGIKSSYTVRKNMKSFKNLGKFPIISSLRVHTPDEAIYDIADSEKQGAEGFLLHVQLLDKNYRTAESIEKIVKAATKPVMILNYRTAENSDDEELNALKLEGLRAGAAAIDLPFNSFDYDCRKSLESCSATFVSANPDEVSMNPAVIEKQKAFIGKVHEAGGEVLVSAHVGTMLTRTQGIDLAKEIESRGADYVKIILCAKNMDDVAEIFDTIRELKRTLRKPFLYQTYGLYGKLVRPTAWMFGSCMILCHNRYTELSNREKPLIADVKCVREKLYSEEYKK